VKVNVRRSSFDRAPLVGAYPQLSSVVLQYATHNCFPPKANPSAGQDVNVPSEFCRSRPFRVPTQQFPPSESTKNESHCIAALNRRIEVHCVLQNRKGRGVGFENASTPGSPASHNVSLPVLGDAAESIGLTAWNPPCKTRESLVRRYRDGSARFQVETQSVSGPSNRRSATHNHHSGCWDWRGRGRRF